MDFSTKQSLLRRITSRKFYTRIKYKFDSLEVIFEDPSLDLLNYADYIYRTTYDDYKEELMTLEESYSKLTEDGKWSIKLQKEMDALEESNKAMIKGLPKLRFHKRKERSVKDKIVENKLKIADLYSKKNQLWRATIEYHAMQSKRKFLVSKITTLANNNDNLLQRQDFLELLSVYYFEQENIPTEKVRELARSDPFRLYWILSKDTGTPLFPYSSVEMTENQYHLVIWAKVYDMAFESTNRPSQDIIDDDEKFDAWYQDEVNRNKTERQENSNASGHEVYVPCDEESIKDVMALNSSTGKQIIQKRQKTIKEKGEIEEQNLPDIKRDLSIKMNQLAAKSGIK